MLARVINLSRNVQVSCPLLELCSGHVVTFQVKVPEISLIRQLVRDVAKSFTVWISTQNRDFFWSLTQVSWHILFQCGRWVSPDWRSCSSLKCCRNTVFCGRFTLFFCRLSLWWRLYQRFIIFIFRIGLAQTILVYSDCWVLLVNVLSLPLCCVGFLWWCLSVIYASILYFAVPEHLSGCRKLTQCSGISEDGGDDWKLVSIKSVKVWLAELRWKPASTIINE